MSCCCEEVHMTQMCVKGYLVLSCLSFFCFLFFFFSPFFFFPIYGYNPTLPRMFLTRFEGCSYSPTLLLPRHMINSKEKMWCCKGRRKKQFYFCLFCCCVCLLWWWWFSIRLFLNLTKERRYWREPEAVMWSVINLTLHMSGSMR